MIIKNLLYRLLPHSFKTAVKNIVHKILFLKHKVLIDYYFLSYPKCGRTWLRVILGKYWASKYKLPTELNNYELNKLWKNNANIPFIFVTHGGTPAWKHFSEITLPKYLANKKVLLMVRDPRDVVVSLFYHMKYRNKAFDGNLSNFLRYKGGIESIITYYNLFIDKQDQFKDLYILRYEDLRNNTFQKMLEVLHFFGENDIDSQSLNLAIEYSKFDAMQQREANQEKADNPISEPLKPADLKDNRSFKTRSGKVGAYRNELSLEDINYVNTTMQNLNKKFDYN